MIPGIDSTIHFLHNHYSPNLKMILINLNSTNMVSKLIKISLSLTLMVFVLTMTPASTFFEVIKPAEAAPTNKCIHTSNKQHSRY